ncbi:calcium uptake protein 3, mitochondrial isoform X2 [Rhinichthys klamathensis goyatoka]|uniref:calcium uptake protein 3, mitochondrial isoform X2 n=1 Tax=Rhinichthys klamathensis goyatoka TaxID=3034132 RepID=UPI0024B4BDB7|nr:calcium uptake protein 3, mitochondrial isoform X2 [Rhinichthys klamathensis goyatoka]
MSERSLLSSPLAGDAVMMAAVRRVLALRNKFTSLTNGLNLYFNSRQSLRERTALRYVGTGVCITLGGFAVVYYQHISSPYRGHAASLRALISPLPAVAAKEQASVSAEDEEVFMSAHEHRFRLFSSMEYDGQLYMTPLDFIESVTMSEPKKKRFWRSLTKQDLDKILSDTPPVWKGSSRLFRNQRERGVIAYTEYLFLLCILTKPHAGFKIAFNMFDADGNKMVDRREFMVLEDIFRKKKEKKKERGGDPDSSSQLVLKKEQPQSEPRSFWDVLRLGARIVLFSDLMEHAAENVTDTTLLVHFFGRKGKSELNFDDFYRFMDNLQTEVLEIEFLSFSKGMTTISEEDFASILLRYTTVENITGYLENVRQSIPDEKGITFEEFRSFFQFLNNLEDFAIAMQMYNYANRPIGQDEFARAVYVATGLKLSRHLVNTIFKIFDVDHDDHLSYKEFIGIMKDRLHRGSSWGYKGEERFTSFKACMKKELTAK